MSKFILGCSEFMYDVHDFYVDRVATKERFFEAAEYEMLLLLIVYNDVLDHNRAIEHMCSEVTNTLDDIVFSDIVLDDEGYVIACNRVLDGIAHEDEVSDFTTRKATDIYGRMIESPIIYDDEFQRLAKRIREHIYASLNDRLYDEDEVTVVFDSKQLRINLAN